eukprot:6194451-Pleurochrysis_carterae.AAC.1
MFEGSNKSSDSDDKGFDSADGLWASCNECDEVVPPVNDDGKSSAGEPSSLAPEAHNFSSVDAERISGRGKGPAPSRMNLTTGVTDRRGSHKRTEATQKRLGHYEYAYQHWKMVTENTIGRPCLKSCPFQRNCGINFSPKQLLTVHEQ